MNTERLKPQEAGPARRPHLVYVCSDRGIPLTAHRGSSVHVRELASSLALLDLDVTLCMARAPGTDRVSSLTVVPIPKDSLSRRIGSSVQARGGREKGREFLDLVRNFELRRRLERLHRKKPVDFILERMSLFSYAGLQFARQRRIPFLLEVNAPLAREHAEHRQMELTDFAVSIEQVLLAEADRIIAVSSEIRDFAISCGAKPGRIAVLPNAADSIFLDAETWAAETGRPFTVGFVGSLKSWHGLSELLEAFSRFSKKAPDSLLLLVGDGPERLNLEALADKLEIAEKIEWAGEIPHDSVPRFLGRMDVAVAPYPQIPHFYFSPLKIAEYMASGRTIVASRIGQMAEILDNRKTALLYKPGSIQSLAACLLRLAGDRNFRECLGKNAREASKNRTWRDNARVILKLAEEAAEELRP